MTTLHAALVTPLTGPLGLYGKACAAALDLWARKAAHLPASFTKVQLDVHDAGEDLHNALDAALQNRPAVLFGPYGSGPMLTLARSCPQLIWNHGGASSQLARPIFRQIVNVLSPASTYFAAVLQAIHASDPTANRVTLFHSTTGFGRDVATGAMTEAIRLQMTLRTVSFAPSQALQTAASVPDGDILLVVGNFADERAVAPLFISQRWRYLAFVGAGVEEVLMSLSEQREGLLGPAQWIAHAAPEPDEGPDASWFMTHYRQEEGGDPPYAAAQAFAAGLLYARCLRDAGDPRDESIQEAAHKLVAQTLFGKFQLDPLTGLQTGHQVVVVQWHQKQRRVVWPPEQAERPLVPFQQNIH